jgi:hypothetical protein
MLSLSHLQQIPSWEAYSFSASQAIPRILFTRQFMAMFTTARHLYWAKIIKHTPSYTVSVRFFLILSSCLCLGLPNDFFPSLFPWKLFFFMQAPMYVPPHFSCTWPPEWYGVSCANREPPHDAPLSTSQLPPPRSPHNLYRNAFSHTCSQWQNKFYTPELFFYFDIYIF